jgi:hypothetical protein
MIVNVSLRLLYLIFDRLLGWLLLIGRRSRDLAPEQRREVVHADDLVPLRSDAS